MKVHGKIGQLDIADLAKRISKLPDAELIQLAEILTKIDPLTASALSGALTEELYINY